MAKMTLKSRYETIQQLLISYQTMNNTNINILRLNESQGLRLIDNKEKSSNMLIRLSNIPIRMKSSIFVNCWASKRMSLEYDFLIILFVDIDLILIFVYF